MKTALMIAFATCLAATLFADVVTLKNGTKLEGRVEAGGSQVRVRVGSDVRVIAISEIQSIDFTDGRTTEAAPSKPAVTSVVTTPVTPAANGQTITLPAGTEIAVRTIDTIDSKKADPAKEYAASLDDPIVVDGTTIAPANARAILRVTDIKNPKVMGHASMSTYVAAVFINGQRVNLDSDHVESQAGSQAKRGGIGSGVGAAAGAGVGGAAGGAAGAGSGAAAGAAAGAATAMWKNKTVDIKSETRFTYKLSREVTVTIPESAK